MRVFTLAKGQAETSQSRVKGHILRLGQHHGEGT